MVYILIHLTLPPPPPPTHVDNFHRLSFKNLFFAKFHQLLIDNDLHSGSMPVTFTIKPQISTCTQDGGSEPGLCAAPSSLTVMYMHACVHVHVRTCTCTYTCMHACSEQIPIVQVAVHCTCRTHTMYVRVQVPAVYYLRSYWRGDAYTRRSSA